METMVLPAIVAENVLNPGEIFFGGGRGRVTTLLGSCVALTLWHPRAQMGGMCHYLLPDRPVTHRVPVDGRYAEFAFAELKRLVKRSGHPLEEFELGIFGGGNMFPSAEHSFGGRIGMLNIEAARQFAREHGLRPKRSEVGGAGYRNIVLDLCSGHVGVRHVVIDTSVPGGTFS